MNAQLAQIGYRIRLLFADRIGLGVAALVGWFIYWGGFLQPTLRHFFATAAVVLIFSLRLLLGHRRCAWGGR